MTEQELITIINEFSLDKIQSIESIDTKSKSDRVKIVGVSGIKRIEFTLTESGDLSARFLNNKLKKFT